MFDPTVFDNLKVVIEGAVYDLDLVGQINVIERQDLIDLARMSRACRLAFTKGDDRKVSSASIQLSMDLENLSAELLERKGTSPGCHVYVGFLLKMDKSFYDGNKLEKSVRDIWGEEREIIQTVSYKYTEEDQLNIAIAISFGRLIYEENVDDLEEMVDYMVRTLELLP